MNRFPGTTIDEDREAMTHHWREQLRRETGRIAATLGAIDEWAWDGVASPEYQDPDEADVALARARADTLAATVAPLLRPPEDSP